MRTYDYACGCGARFEALVAGVESTPPPCPACGQETRRLPAAGAALLGRAKVPPTAAKAPRSWEGTYRGDTEFIAHWRRALDERAGFEERHPEFAERRPPVAAHEGPYHAAPLTVDELARGASPRPIAHPHPHTHTPAHPHVHPHQAGRHPAPAAASDGRRGAARRGSE